MDAVLTSEDGRSRVVLQGAQVTVYFRSKEAAATDEWRKWRSGTYTRAENSDVLDLVFIMKKKGGQHEESITADFTNGTFTMEYDWTEE